VQLVISIELLFKLKVLVCLVPELFAYLVVEVIDVLGQHVDVLFVDIWSFHLLFEWNVAFYVDVFFSEVHVSVK
jgi:hypothetical protein